MERLIDITKFFIIKPEQFNQIILDYNFNISDSNYFSTLLLANIFAYAIIVIFFIFLIWLLKKVFKRRKFYSRRMF